MFGQPTVQKMVKHSRRVCVSIEQFGAFTIEFPARIIHSTSTDVSLGSPIISRQRYIPKSSYRFTLKNILTGYECKPLVEKELHDSVIRQNSKCYYDSIDKIIKDFKLKNDIGDQNVEYDITFFEDLTKERKYECETEEYYTSV